MKRLVALTGLLMVAALFVDDASLSAFEVDGINYSVSGNNTVVVELNMEHTAVMW